jgi:hypothetical protein
MGGIIALGTMTVGLMLAGKHFDDPTSPAPPFSGNRVTSKV